MAKYKILVIQHCLKNNKIAKFGEIVDESQLTSSSFDLVQQGFIKLVSKKELVKEPEVEEEEEEEDDEKEVAPKKEIKNSFKNKK